MHTGTASLKTPLLCLRGLANCLRGSHLGSHRVYRTKGHIESWTCTSRTDGPACPARPGCAHGMRREAALEPPVTAAHLAEGSRPRSPEEHGPTAGSGARPGGGREHGGPHGPAPAPGQTLWEAHRVPGPPRKDCSGGGCSGTRSTSRQCGATRVSPTSTRGPARCLQLSPGSEANCALV